MRFIKPSVELWKQTYDLEGIYDHISGCVRVCYQSTPKDNGENSYDFINRVIFRDKNKASKSNHLSVLEHGTVYLNIPMKCNTLQESAMISKALKLFKNNPYSRVITDNINYYITTNFRVIIENDMLPVLRYLAKPSIHERRYTVSVITDIGVTREFNRHRCHSITEESTRYCNYSKDKFGNGLTFVTPAWSNIPEGVNYSESDNFFNTPKADYTYMMSCLVAENNYNQLIALGWKPEQAREVLPLGLKTQVIHTAFKSDWVDFINLRSKEISGKAHPNIKIIADKIKVLLNL